MLEKALEGYKAMGKRENTGYQHFSLSMPCIDRLRVHSFCSVFLFICLCTKNLYDWNGKR